METSDHRTNAMQSLPPAHPAIEISLASRGFSKGIAQTRGVQIVARPEVQIGPVLLGGYAKNVSSADYDGEAGVSIAVRRKVAGIDLSGSATIKRALGAGRTLDATALEVAASAARTAGRLGGRLNWVFSPDELGTTKRSHYLEAVGTISFGGRITASAGVGRRQRRTGPDYTSYNAGLSYKLSSEFTADVRWYGNNRHHAGDFYRERLVGALRARF
jgi:hypothetical protein